jgi:exodeoxyribonuclease V alpha subunit
VTVNALREALLASRVVGTPQRRGVMPLILDDDDRLYLHRYFDYETRLASCLAARCAIAPQSGGMDLPASVAAALERLFGRNAGPEQTPDWQQIAVITALLGRLTIISGGPGTGKTTAIVNLLVCVLEEKPDCRIALAAPTGKAAARIIETIRRRAGHLPAELASRLPQESFTVHRLLGVRPDGGFRHDAANPLPIDVLVIDEASMLDLALAARLFEAVPPAARVILAGDKDQLAAVESGAVFAELSADPTLSAARVELLARICGVRPAAIQPGPPRRAVPLSDSVIWLRRNFRFGSGSAIGQLASAINAGDASTALARLRDASDHSLAWRDDGAAEPSRESIETLCHGYAHYVDSFRTGTLDPALATREFARYRILCAVRDGPRGTRAINERMGAHFRGRVGDPAPASGRSEWYPGRPVIVLRNDYRLQLYNGDIGIALRDAAGEFMVYFPDGESSLRAVPAVRLPDHETAFALTVHKAQGSEFDEVLVLLPAEPSRVLTRELLYTAVTRSRERVIVMGDAQVIEAAIGTPTDRLSGLEARLREAAGRIQPAGLLHPLR